MTPGTLQRPPTFTLVLLGKKKDIQVVGANVHVAIPRPEQSENLLGRVVYSSIINY